MPNRSECVVCRFKLPLCMRVDTQYCGGTCRVRAFRARRQRRSIAGRWDQHAGRQPDPAPDSPLTRARIRLAIEHALRTERAQQVDLAERLARSERVASKRKQELTAERGKLNAALENEQTTTMGLLSRLVSQQMDTERQQKVAAEHARQLDAESARARALTAELESNREATRKMRQAINNLRSSRDRDRKTLDSVRFQASKDAQGYTAQVESLFQELSELREASKQTAQWNGRQVSDSWEYSEEHDAIKSLQRALSEAHTQLANQRRQIAEQMQELDAVTKNIISYQRANAALRKELTDSHSALEVQKRTGRIVATSLVETRLQGTGESYSGALNGHYNSRLDGLAMSKQNELLASADLARWQAVNGKRQTARELDPNTSIENQAMEAAIAARWALLSDPPKALRWRPTWRIWGFVLDNESEAYLGDVSSGATMKMTLSVPKKARRLGPY